MEPDPRSPVAALAVRGIVKRFGPTLAVDAVDLDVRPGELVALLGPSGCGKSTVLRLVAGLERPDAGTIEVAGRRVAGPGTDVAPERRGVGMVFQEHALFPHLDVGANVAFGLRAVAPLERRARVGELLALVGLAGAEGRRPGSLSGGEAQRVALARALAPRPPLLLLDEPFSSLDATLRASVREEVRAILRAAEQTALLVTHDQDEALSMADRVAVMAAGRIRQVDDPRTLYRAPTSRTVAEFVGDGDVVPGTRAGRFLLDTPLGRIATTAPLEGPDHVAVLRPEQVRLLREADGPAVVESVAFHGHDQLVLARLPDGRVVRARRPVDPPVRRGERVRLEIDGPALTFPA